ncbi:MAG TPA: hypothetical protein VGE74_24475 [Gemmata sp.]
MLSYSPGFSLLAASICLLLGGCGGATSDVRGKVSAQGKTVVWGTVTLLDERGNYHQVPIDPNGKYEAPGVAVGSVKIGVVSPNPEGRSGKGSAQPARKGNETAEGRPGGRDKGPPADRAPRPVGWFAIDPKFADPTTSGLTGEIKPGTTELNIDVK